MTISPPSNVKIDNSPAGLGPSEPARVLASGVDTLVLGLDVKWQDSGAFSKLAELKAAARASEEDYPGILKPADGSAPWIYTVEPHGVRGYEWMLSSGELVLKIGSSMEPTSRPSVMAEIRSEALWMHGAAAMADRVRLLLESCKGKVLAAKPSRVDICVDLLLREEDWRLALIDRAITRAATINTYQFRGKLTGIKIGSGVVSARLYDKPQEIATKSNKIWMYDIWKLESVPAGHRIIRIEFQLRREALKQMVLNTMADLQERLDSLWAYLTQGWLRLVEDASKHHTQQQVLPWWRIVQGGIDKALEAHPLVRGKAIEADENRNAAQIVGHLATMTALERQGELIGHGEVLDVASHVDALVAKIRQTKMSDEAFTKRVKRRQAKLMRHQEEFAKTHGVKRKSSR